VTDDIKIEDQETDEPDEDEDLPEPKNDEVEEPA
jgi:hypothetical protein